MTAASRETRVWISTCVKYVVTGSVGQRKLLKKEGKSPQSQSLIQTTLKHAKMKGSVFYVFALMAATRWCYFICIYWDYKHFRSV